VLRSGVADEPRINPYAPPAADSADQPPPLAPATTGRAFPHAMFSPRQILAAVLVGTLLAGVILLQGNFRAMGRTRDANRALLFGMLASVAVTAMLFILPEGVPGLPINIAIALAFYKLAESLQGASFLSHREAGGARHSNWTVVGIAVGTAVALLVILFVVIQASGGGPLVT
jgi:hypothetical protein